MKLKDLLRGIANVDSDLEISGLASNSKEVTQGDGFIALAGAKQDGLRYAKQAVDQGACVIIYDQACERGSWFLEIDSVPVIAIEYLSLKLGDIAARFYGDPSRSISVIGITGTNGKTSCSHFLSQVLADCGIIGTIGWGELGRLKSTLNTTPDALTLQRMFFELLKEKKQAVAMEVSSHGLKQGRVNAVHFKGVVFTNISRDHLDYHGSMDDYLHTKLSLLNKPNIEFAVVNLDDTYSDRIISVIPQSVALWTISSQGKTLKSANNIITEYISHKNNGIEMVVRWNEKVQKIFVPLFGDFNVENVLCVLAVMLAMDISLAESATRLAQLKPVAGRMERFGGEEPLVVVDYAHTPDALNKVLSSLKNYCLNPENGKVRALWVVFGCGGDRDKGKRPQMGRIAEQWADHVVITDDNPRFETNSAIIADILEGCIETDKIEIIQDRQQAIESVISRAGNEDCILIAGKGHELYQENKGVQTVFSDKQIVVDALTRRNTTISISSSVSGSSELILRNEREL